MSELKQPLVSVVIATYNMGQYLCFAVDSILEQKWSNLEVIIVDDGSSDDTESRMKEYIKNPKIKYTKTINHGQPKAKNRGLRESKGEFIAFCDADDRWESNKLNVQMQAFSDDKVGVVYSDVSLIDENGKSFEGTFPYSFHSGKITNQLMQDNFIPFGTAIIRKKCVEKNGYFDEEFPMGIDWDLWLRYSIEWEFQYIPVKTYIYRVWSGQMSKDYKGRYENAFRILNKFISNNQEGLDEKYVRKALSGMFIDRANHIREAEKVYVEPLRDIYRGLRIEPLSLKGWKSIIKLMIY